MIVAWMLYGLAVGALMGVGAAALERVLRAYGWPGRWAWAGAVAGTVVGPAVAWLVGARPAGGAGGAGVVVGSPDVVAVAPGLPLEAAARPVLEALNGPLAALWVLASAAFVLHLAVAAVRLRLRRRGWRADSVEGERVLVSPDTGPAVLGWLRGTVVLPEWTLGLKPGWRRLVVAHEREHVRAYDPALLALGLLGLVLFPWNAALWWQVRRLRLAVELDCDERVLRAHPDVSEYGGLLIEVGRRVSLTGALVAALSEPRSFLEWRIRRMVGGRGRRRVVQVVGLAVVCVGVLVLACETPIPERMAGVAEPPRRSVAELADEPVSTPFTMPPELQNRSEVQQALVRFYPPLLRDAGIGGTSVVWFLIDETGAVRDTRIKESAGHEALDQAALRIGKLMRFSPALNRGEPVPVWVSLPIQFGHHGSASAETAAAPRSRTGAAGPGDPSANPAPTPYTTPPKLVNAAEVREALARHYPPELRGAGVGASVLVWFNIDETGRVQRTLIKEPSGNAALDQAAVKVAEIMRFTPPLNQGEPVPVWVAMPITFTPN